MLCELYVKTAGDSKVFLMGSYPSFSLLIELSNNLGEHSLFLFKMYLFLLMNYWFWNNTHAIWKCQTASGQDGQAQREVKKFTGGRYSESVNVRP